ncbi:M23 family metallopeptidase [Sphaerotilus sulfidivorans]|uniref:M23 family metallopeptidase n=1 Tax=Sphaerotilus sulfidivorans TaxID=639200 RepID=A0A5C1Q2J6_9BURK|nr:M23 family metallopeptidase [Sphaerotilus sulfidivorans]QEN01777.1 M23 family metallopeptidase [Sphaerotilus sulfidivorans]
MRPRTFHEPRTSLVNKLGEKVRLQLAHADLTIRRHPKTFSAIVTAALTFSGVTAFGVAPLSMIDSTPKNVQTVVETVTPSGLDEQAEALAEYEMLLHRTDLTRSTDTADTLLRRLGVSDPEAAQFLRTDPAARTILSGRPGKMLQAVTESTPGGGQLQELVVRGPAADSAQNSTHFTRITVRRDDSGLKATSEQLPMQVETRTGAATISSTLFAAADEARLPDAVTGQIAEMFGSDIDFRRELRKGDRFSVVYETMTADGEPVTWGTSSGRVLAARFINGNDTHAAVWFQEPGTKGAYFSPDGKSKAKAFLASPLAFSRVTSGFAMRFHPIMQTWRAHLGVDYGAPTGTPVRVVGDGVVDFAGVQNGYGNVVIVKHSGDRATVYAHLSRIDVRKGQSVSQSDLIGAVGATGWATGPHLHFEFKVKGAHVDPMQIARAAQATELSAAARARFDSMSRQLQEQLASAERDQATRSASAAVPRRQRME